MQYSGSHCIKNIYQESRFFFSRSEAGTEICIANIQQSVIVSKGELFWFYLNQSV